jgi:RHS repeat-associated protein
LVLVGQIGWCSDSTTSIKTSWLSATGNSCRCHPRTFGYSETDRIARQSIRGATEQIDRHYNYDPAGNLIAKQDNTKGPWRFSHDPMGRITQAFNPEQQLQNLSYDPAGDLLEHLPDTAAGLRSARYNGRQYSYDPAGNLVQRRSGDDLIRFDWDEQNRLRTARTGDDTRIDMAYDALGRRCGKAVNGERTFFMWDGDALLSEQFEDGPVREYVYYPGTFEPLAAIDGDGSIHYYHNDPNGLPQELTDANGTIVWSASYDALGRVNEILVDDVPQPLRMQGQYYDPEIDLCYNRYRYFDPQICAFISQDPLGLAAGENIYAYAPNVWGWVDPLGLACKQALPEYKNWQGFRKVFNSKSPAYMTRRYARGLWHEYQETPDKFFGRQKVQDILKARGDLPYTPAERVDLALAKANTAYINSHTSDSWPNRIYHFGFEFFKGLKTPPGTPIVYDTLAGNLGSLVSSIVGKLLPF